MCHSRHDVEDGHADSPVVECSTGVFTALDFDHEQREKQEEHSHSEANTVHGLVANQHITVHMSLHTRNRRTPPSFTETWNLEQHKKRQCIQVCRSAAPATKGQRSHWMQQRHCTASQRKSTEIPQVNYPPVKCRLDMS